MSKNSYIKTLLNKSVLDDENVKWCDTANDLDDMAYVIYINFTSSDDFRKLLEPEIGEKSYNMKMKYSTQEDIIAIYNGKQNAGINKIYNYSKDYLRKIKLMSLNDIE